VGGPTEVDGAVPVKAVLPASVIVALAPGADSSTQSPAWAGRDSPIKVTAKATAVVANRLQSGVMIGILTRATESFSPMRGGCRKGGSKRS